MSRNPATTVLNVLVVDDDPDIVEVIQLTLEACGYTAITACGGAAALDRLRTGNVPQVILLDMMMPDVDGWAFRAEQVADPTIRDVPVIVMTADQHAEDKAGAIDAAGYLKKPISLDTLIEMIARFCGPRARAPFASTNLPTAQRG